MQQSSVKEYDDGWRWVPCEACGGAGEVEHLHPWYGQASCPFPTVDRVCMDCFGCGEQLVRTEPATLEDLEAHAETEQPGKY